MGNATFSLKPRDPSTVRIVESLMRRWLPASLSEIEGSRPPASEFAVAQPVRLIHHPLNGSPIIQRAMSAEGLYEQFQCQPLTRLIASVRLKRKLKAGCGLTYSV
jgi:hypothetical protein